MIRDMTCLDVTRGDSRLNLPDSRLDSSQCTPRLGPHDTGHGLSDSATASTLYDEMSLICTSKYTIIHATNVFCRVHFQIIVQGKQPVTNTIVTTTLIIVFETEQILLACSARAYFRSCRLHLGLI